MDVSIPSTPSSSALPWPPSEHVSGDDVYLAMQAQGGVLGEFAERFREWGVDGRNIKDLNEDRLLKMFPQNANVFTLWRRLQQDLHGGTVLEGGSLSSPDIYRFWETFTESEISETGVLRWKEGCSAVALGIGADAWILVRPAYVAIVDSLIYSVANNQKGHRLKFSLSGTPGVGKSLFALYLFHRLLQPGISIYYRYEVDKIVLLRKGFAPLQVSSRDLDRADRSSWYIIDTRLENPPIAPCTTLWISSPRGSPGFKQFDKDISGRIFLPPWDENEIGTMIGLRGMSEEMVAERFRRFGGVARFLFQGNDENAEDDALRLEAALNSRKAFDALHVEGSAHAMRDLNHFLVHMYPTLDPNGVTRWGVRSTMIASPYVFDRLAARSNFEQLQILSRVLGTATALGGNLFERYFHKYMTMPHVAEKQLACRALPADGTSSDMFTVSFGELRLEYFVELPENVENGVYYVPSNLTFNAIDSFCAGSMFQVTVSMSHDVNFTGRVTPLPALLASAPLYFVVPERHFSTFAHQRVTVPRGQRKPDQFVIGIPVDL